jgi:hypothetical protein
VKGVVVVHTIQATTPELKTQMTLHHHGLQRYQLGLHGRLEPGWAGRLSNGLAQRRVNIMRVEAARSVGWQWRSTIDLDFFSASVRPDAIDFVSLSQVPAATSPVPDTLLLDDYLLERSTRCEGSLYLEVSGPDRIGLLSSLLNTFSLYALFPAEMLVETQKKRVFDRFWLKGLGGTAPSAEATAAIKERMQECTYGARIRS